MRTADFDFHLPAELIAQEAQPRGESRLLVMTPEGLAHQGIRDFPSYLNPGDLLVLNDTRVIPARLFARRRPGGGHTELLLLEKQDLDRWTAMARPAKKLRVGSMLDLSENLEAEVLSVREGRVELRFNQEIESQLEDLGHVPLPPYIRRADTAEDRDRYQTVWAEKDGAIAAPTAGLHFDQALLGAVQVRGVRIARVTLHVGIGTFLPVTAEMVAEHQMEEERWAVNAQTAELLHQTRQAGGKVFAVGTTVVRTLETFAQEGFQPGSGRTRLFITPGYQFQIVDRLLTNFHLPQSTLLMLVSALVGRKAVLEAYGEAVREKYRFYSYGDAMLVGSDI